MKSLFLGSLFLFSALAAPVGAAEEPTIDRGIQQIRDGRLDDALATLDAVVVRLQPEAATRKAELIRALVHRGWAQVALLNEDAARQSFREALELDPALRLVKGDYPDRVVRVFDAARKGKRESAMERPSGAPKKAGIGAAGVALIAGGVVAAGAGVAVAGGGSEAATPAPSPTPTPVPTTITPTASSGPGRIEFVNSDPGIGQRVATKLAVAFRVTSDQLFNDVTLVGELFRGTTFCSQSDGSTGQGVFLRPGEPQTIVLEFFPVVRCGITDSLVVYVFRRERLIVQSFAVQFDIR